MMTRGLARTDRLNQRIADQMQWIEQHGGSLPGYVERYGSKDDAKHFGDGGELIYAADVAALDNLTQELNRNYRGR